MKTDFVLTPENHDEMTVIDLLAEARRVALEDAEMDPAQLAVVYNQYAIGILQSDSRVSEDVLTPSTR